MSEHLELLSNCEQELLHHSNAIQSFGVFIAINFNLQITHVSSNIEKFLGICAEKALGLPISRLLGENYKPDSGINGCLENSRINYGLKLAEQGYFDCVSTRLENAYLIHLEPVIVEKNSSITHSHLMSKILHLSQTNENFNHIMLEATKLIQNITGFDKVMLYQFQDDMSGEVICEIDPENRFESYLGLRFPASDIPQIARDLYIKTPYRLIADVNSDSVDIISKTNNSIDLTFADLRSVSPVHIEYLKNMNVGASLSFSLVVNEQLWGLFALHHKDAKTISLDKRHQCTELVKAFCLTLQNHLFKQRMELIDSSDKKISRILNKLDLKSGNLSDLLSIENQLLDMLQANNGAIIDDKIMTLGGQINENIILAIDDWFMQKHENTFYTHHLGKELSTAQNWKEIISGVFALKILKPSSKQFIRFYWFRSEQPQQIHWAGNPEKTVSRNGNIMTISPRESFKKWTENTQGYSKPWSNAENMIIMKFRSMILGNLLH